MASCEPKTKSISGAVKANIGHLEATSGLAGLIKSVLVLEKGLIPPIANLIKPNPAIDAEFWNLKVHERVWLGGRTDADSGAASFPLRRSNGQDRACGGHQ